MNGRATTRSKGAVVRAAGCMAGAAWCTSMSAGGTGTMRQVGPSEWVLDFCVSVRFDATEAQLDRVREAFELGSPILSDATDGQVRFGRVSIFNNSQGGQEAEVWIHPGSGGAFATYGMYGDYDHHITMYYGSNIASADIDSFPDRAAYTMAHEFAHHVWNIRDEYSGVGCAESDPDCVPDMQNCCDCEAWPHSPTASYCLMDNYFTRGGNLGASPSGTGTYTLNEFCIGANHDPDGDTFQESSHGVSCWTYITNHPDRGLGDPGVPTEAPVATPGVQFFDEDVVQPRFVLCMDTSGSMATQDLDDTASRLHRLKQAGHVFINLLNDGDELGVVEYSTNADSVFMVQSIDDANDRQAAKDIITAFAANGSTAIGRGLRESRDLLTPLPDSCTQRILLCSDGYGNTGPDELTFIPSLVNNRLPTSCLAIGGSVSEDNLKQIAYQTGGTYTHVISGSDIPQSYAFAYAEMSDLALQSKLESSVGGNSFFTWNQDSEAEIVGTVVLLIWLNPDAQLKMSLVDPHGQFIDEGVAAGDASVDHLTGLDHLVYKVRRPYPDVGGWTMVIQNLGAEATDFQLLTFVESPEVSLAVGTDRRVYPCGEAVRVFATPQYGGRAVRDVWVTAEATHPGGQVQNLVLLDDGAWPDEVGGDGVYAASMPAQDDAGGIRIEVRAQHVGGGLTSEGEMALFVDDPVNVEAAPAFDRRARTSAVVVCCRADVNGDGRVDFEDLNVVLGNWRGQVPPYTGGDTNGNGLVEFNDLNRVLAAWGKGIIEPGV